MSSTAMRQRAETMEELSSGAKSLYEMLTAETREEYESMFMAHKRKILDAVRVKASSTTSSAPLPVRRSTVPISNPTPIYSRAVSATPAPAISMISTVLLDPTAVSVAPIAADINGTDLAASVPITCSSGCPSHDDAASVSILISSAKQASSTTIGNNHSEPAAPMVDDKPLDVDAMAGATLMATVCLPTGPDHSINGEDPMDMSLTPWSASPSFNVPPEDLPSLMSEPIGVPELFMWLPSTCLTDCPGSSIMMFSACTTTHTTPSCLFPSASSADAKTVRLHDMMFALNSYATQTSADCSGRRIDKPPSLLVEAYQVFNVVPTATEIVPWPPPSCTRAGTSLSYGHDLCHNAQQKRGREFFVEVMGSPPTPPVQDLKYNQGKQSANWLEVKENRHQIEGIEVVRLQLTWISSLRVCLNPPTAAANSAIVKNMHCKRLSDPDESVRVASRCSVVVYTPRLEDGQPRASADMLQSHKLYFTRQSSWEGAMLVGQHRILMRCNHSDLNSFDIELVLDGDRQAWDGSFFTRLLIQRAYKLMPWKIACSFSFPLYICSCHTVSVQSSTTTILPAEKFDFQLGLYSSSDQLVTGNTPHLVSQKFGLHLHWTCFQPTIYPSRFSAAEVSSLVHGQREGWFQFCPAGKASLYSYGTVQFQWEIAWPPTKFVGLFANGLVTNISSRNGNNDYIESVLRLIIKLFSGSRQIKWPAMSLTSPFMISADVHQEFVGMYSVTAVLSQLLTCVVRWNEAMHWPFFQSYTGKTILLLWDPGKSLHAGISLYLKGKPCPCVFELLQWKIAWTLILESLTESNGNSANYSVVLTFTSTSYACVREFHQGSLSDQTSRMFFAKVTTAMHIITYQLLLLVKTHGLGVRWTQVQDKILGKIISSQVYYSNAYSVLDITFLQTMTECSAIDLPWDPGGSSRHRLGGKPNLKSGGLSATPLHSLLGWLDGPLPWAWPAREAAEEANLKHICEAEQREGIGLERKDGRRLRPRPGLGVCVACVLVLPLLPPRTLASPSNAPLKSNLVIQ